MSNCNMLLDYQNNVKPKLWQLKKIPVILDHTYNVWDDEWWLVRDLLKVFEMKVNTRMNDFPVISRNVIFPDKIRKYQTRHAVPMSFKYSKYETTGSNEHLNSKKYSN